MQARKTAIHMPTSLRGIANRARKDKKARFGGLYRLLNEENLRGCFYQLRRSAAPGVDKVTFEEYERDMDANLADLVGRLKGGRYRAKLVRRKYIAKANGKLRPLGIPALEDKLLQIAAAQILAAIYEQDFLDCSWGYRPKRGARDASRALAGQLYTGRIGWVVEADIRGFLDPYSYYTLAAEADSNSSGWLSMTQMRKPFCLPRLTCTTESSPRFTRCMIV